MELDILRSQEVNKPQDHRSSVSGLSKVNVSDSSQRLYLRNRSSYVPDTDDEEAVAYDKMLILITSPSLNVLQVLSKCGHGSLIDALVKTTTHVFGSLGTLLPIVAHAICWEVANSTTTSMFGSASFSTKLISAATFMYGKAYLKSVLDPWLETMLECPDMSYEINPNNIDPNDNMGINRSSLRNLMTRFLTAMRAKSLAVPEPIQAIWYLVAFETNKKSPGAAQRAVTNFLFTRFWGPAIACPQKYGIYSESLPQKVARGLVLASKLLQAMPANRPFREEYMQCMNHFRNNSSANLKAYISIVSECPPTVNRIMLHKLARSDVTMTPWLKQMNSDHPPDNDGSVDPAAIEKCYILMSENVDQLEEVLTSSSEKLRLHSIMETLGEPHAVTIISSKFDNCINGRKVLEGTTSPGEWDQVQDTYPGTSFILKPVPNPSWSTMDPSYDPIVYTQESVTGSDPDGAAAPVIITFNEIDVEHGVDRRSKEGNYKIVNGLPRNPKQRTGFAGRGCLPRWGPNHVGFPVISRWCRKSNGEIRKLFNKPVLEVLATRQEDGYIGLIGGDLSTGSSIPSVVASMLGIRKDPHIEAEIKQLTPIQFSGSATKSLLADEGTEVGEPTITSLPTKSLDTAENDVNVQVDLLELLDQGSMLFSGYLDDPRNTDNAWVEMTSWHLHDSSDILKDHLGASVEEHTDPLMFWIPADEDTMWDHHARTVIARATEKVGAHFTDRVLPTVFEILSAIETRGLNHEGLYRVSGSKKNIDNLKQLCYSGNSIAAELANVEDINELTGLVKELLRSMEPPLIPYSLYPQVIDLACHDSMDEQNAAKSELLMSLPHANFKILGLLIQHLEKVAARNDANKMTVENLAVVFGPTVMRSPDGIETDIADQGTQCSGMCALLQTDVTEFDRILSIRNPWNAEILHFEGIADDDVGRPQSMHRPLSMIRPQSQAQASISRPVLSPDSASEDPYALPEDATMLNKRKSSSLYDKLPLCLSSSNAGSRKTSATEEGLYDNTEARTEASEQPKLKEFSSLCSAYSSEPFSSECTEVVGSEVEEDDEGGTWPLVKTALGRNCTETTISSDCTERETDADMVQDQPVRERIVQSDLKSPISASIPQNFDLAGLADLSADDALDAFSPEAVEDDIQSVSAGATLTTVKPNEEWEKVKTEKQANTTSTTSSAPNVKSVATSSNGECQECYVQNVDGWRDPETELFYCTECWNAYEAEDVAEAESEAGSAEEHPAVPFTDAPKADKNQNPLSPVIQLQYDEDGLPMDSVVDDQDEDQQSMEDNYVDLQYDEDGLPVDDHEQWQGPSSPGPVKSPTRKGTVRINLERTVKTEDLLLIASLPTNTQKRKGTIKLSTSVKKLQTRIEGSLHREVGATWKKRYFVLHDTMLKVFKSQSAKSGMPIEYFNITRQSEVARFGDKMFQISIPEKGCVITMRGSGKNAVDEWVRILANSCRIAASLPPEY